jgi:hypothetical protein
MPWASNSTEEDRQQTNKKETGKNAVMKFRVTGRDR